jgi:anti-sigma B factor antagonist
MKIRVNYIKDIAVLTINGRININSSKLIETVGLLLRKGISKMVIDMRNVDFLDYNGLSVLAITYKNALNNNSVMKFCGISLNIQELLRVVKLDDIFEIYDNLDEALADFEDKAKAVYADKDGKQPLRRRFTRLDMDIPVTYKLSKGVFSHKAGGLYTGRMENVSGAGIFLRSIHMLPPGSEVSVGVMLEKDKESAYFNGIIMWLADKDLQPELYPGMGIAFTDISCRRQEEILQFIEKHTVNRIG